MGLALLNALQHCCIDLQMPCRPTCRGAVVPRQMQVPGKIQKQWVLDHSIYTSTNS